MTEVKYSIKACCYLFLLFSMFFSIVSCSQHNVGDISVKIFFEKKILIQGKSIKSEKLPGELKLLMAKSSSKHVVMEFVESEHPWQNNLSYSLERAAFDAGAKSIYIFASGWKNKIQPVDSGESFSKSELKKKAAEKIQKFYGSMYGIPNSQRFDTKEIKIISITGDDSFCTITTEINYTFKNIPPENDEMLITCVARIPFQKRNNEWIIVDKR